jgi:hypothetical protein
VSGPCLQPPTSHGRIPQSRGAGRHILMATEFLVIVSPGLDPGIAPAAGVRWDPRIKSGDDDEKACAPAKIALC